MATSPARPPGLATDFASWYKSKTRAQPHAFAKQTSPKLPDRTQAYQKNASQSQSSIDQQPQASQSQDKPSQVPQAKVSTSQAQRRRNRRRNRKLNRKPKPTQWYQVPHSENGESQTQLSPVEAPRKVRHCNWTRNRRRRRSQRSRNRIRKFCERSQVQLSEIRQPQRKTSKVGAPRKRQRPIRKPKQKFTLFQNLPLELRLEIWHHARPKPRIVETVRLLEKELIANPFGKASTQIASRNPFIALLHVCRESRQETLMTYGPMLSANWNGRQVYVDYNVDTCYISPPCLNMRGESGIFDTGLSTFWRHVVDGWSDRALKSIKALAVLEGFGLPTCHWSDNNNIDYLKPLLKFRSLERIVWVSNELDHCLRSEWPYLRRRVSIEGPLSRFYCLADIDEVLPFRNVSPRQYGGGSQIDTDFERAKETVK